MPDASHDFGAHLRQAREQRGVSLREIADRTKISAFALEALERNDISRLPGGIFTRAFVRSYASEVGLDPEDTVRRFLARFPDESAGESPKAYEPNPEHISVDEPPTFGRAWRAVAWSIPLLLMVGYFGFGGRLPWWGDRAPQQAVRTGDVPTPPPPPAPTVQPLTPADASAHTLPGSEPGVGEAQPPAETGTQAAPAQGNPPAAPAGQTPAAPAPAPGATTAAGQQGAAPAPSATAGAPAVVAPPQSAVPAATPGPSDAVAFRLTLAPSEACWVSVRSNGASIYSGLMGAGERQDLTIHGDVSLTVGNAGAFVYFINGQPGRSLGGPGQVTTVRLNADNLKTFIEPR